MIARNKIIGTKELGPDDSQIDAFNDLQKKRDLLNAKIGTLFNGKTTPGDAELNDLVEAFQALEKELKENVLLPHQVDELGFEEFKSLLAVYNGDLTKVIGLYDSRIEFSDEQKQKLKKLDQTKDAEKRIITEKYMEEIHEIETKANQEMRKILTPKQLTLLEKLSGQKFPNKNDDGS